MNSNGHPFECACWHCEHGVVIPNTNTPPKENTMKPIIRTLTAASLLASMIVLWLAWSVAPAQATGVHHPKDECSATFIKDQPPYSGLTVTAAYTGDMWIKIATQHVYVPVVTEGDVITPQSLSSWPTNRNGKPQEISHVDYCVDPYATTTTEPEQTTTTTTEPEQTTTTTAPEETTTTVVETTVPEETTTTVPERCPEGEYPQSYEPDAPCGPEDPCVDNTDTLWTLQPCGTTTTVPAPTSTTGTSSTSGELPDTGSTSGIILLAALGTLLTGTGVAFASRRP